MNQPVIQDGAVTLQNGRIVSVGPWRDKEEHGGTRVLDLGSRILMPGLINAHCHLDYTNMAGQIPPPKNFPEWIKSILVLKSHWGFSEYAESWLEGASQALRSGTTTLVDIEAVPELLPHVWQATPLRLFSMLELTGVRSSHRPEALLNQSMDILLKLPTNDLHNLGLSPHSPYSTPAELLRLCAQASQTFNLPLAIHVSESQEEFDMFTLGRGLLFDWLKNQREMSACGQGSPIQYLHKSGLLSPSLMAIHANYLDPADLQLLATNRVSVVHCPRSHRYFGHAPFPIEKMIRHGINVCLATDSLASMNKNHDQLPTLNLFEELHTFSSIHPEIDPLHTLKMVTVNAAQALRREETLGEISPDAFSDLIAIPYEGSVERSAEYLVHARPKVDFIMIQGKTISESSTL